ncbi:2-hydroxyglutaryl-CoA dehydratase [Clostridium sp. 'deep sea']|nr:acyl-CoA dehydratase activase [Clostridium sp. 'deep sea']QOR36957.1 2-hydroxyglutaryl-CoA dehydratase [Clostridium sp. 'deep sea']
MYSIGIDSGSVATKGVLYNGAIVKSMIVPTGWSPQKTSLKVYNCLLNEAKQNNVKVIGTGYGRVSMKFVNKTVTEIKCHATGAYYLNNKARTILDIGGQDSKVISLNSNGKVVDFLMNDKCAAGTGRFLQVMVNKLGEDIGKIDQLASGAKPAEISNMCTVFAESEVISLLANGVDKASIAAGIIESIANRACNMIKRVNYKDEIIFTGGLSQSNLLKLAIEKSLGVPVITYENSQLIGALGAAIVGYNLN